jgi:hypothetical protein
MGHGDTTNPGASPAGGYPLRLGNLLLEVGSGGYSFIPNASMMGTVFIQSTFA